MRTVGARSLPASSCGRCCERLAVAPPAGGADLPVASDQGVIPASAGGTQDVFMRALGEDLRKRFGQTLVIENRPGGNFNIGARACAEAPPDGYTICMLPNEALVYNKLLFKKIPVRSGEGFRADHQSVLRDPGDRGECRPQGEEPGRARRAVEGEAQDPELHRARAAALGVHGELQEAAPAPTWCGCRSAAAARPSTACSRARRRSRSPGSRTGRRICRPARSSGWRSTPASALPLIPDVPTLDELGYKIDLTRVYFGIVAPAGTPKPILERLRNEMAAGHQRPGLPREASDVARPRAGRQHARRIRALPGRGPARRPPASSRTPASSRNSGSDSSAACGARHAR